MIFFLVFFSIINSIFAEPIIDPEVLDQFNHSKWVTVEVTLNSLGNKSLNLGLQSDILSSLTDKEFRLSYTSLRGRGFSGNITLEGIKKLKNNPNVLRVYLPIFGGTSLQQSLPLINATKVWNLSYTGKGQTICVIDSGINYTHPNLGNCIRTNNISDGVCNKVIGGYDFYNTDADPYDDYSHGTHVAGIVAANGTLNGTAPYSKIVAVKVTNNQGNWNGLDLAEGIDWCNDNKNRYNISVITISLGTFDLYNNATICDTTLVGISANEAYNNGIFIDASSGNNANLTHMTLPACASNVTSVGSVYDSEVGAKSFCTQVNGSGNCIKFCSDITTYTDKMSCFTNRGLNLDLLAPGSVINSTYIDGAYFKDSGTSMAAPHVAGAAALLLEADPTLTPNQIKTILQDKGKPVQDIFDGCQVGIQCTNLTFKRINVLEAVNSFKWNYEKG